MQACAPRSSKWIIYILVAVTVLVFALSLRDALKYPGIDLRCKVVGARRLLAGLDVYPSAGTPEPNPYFRMFNNNTYSPFLLLLYSPLCSLPYGVQRLIYFGLDWLFIAYMFARIGSWFPGGYSLVYKVLFVLLLIADFALRIHSERGQCYILIALLTVTAIHALKEPQDRWLGAISLGILLLVRPTYLVAAAVLWVTGYRRHARLAVLTAAVGLLLTLCTFGPQVWIGYAKTITRMQKESVEGIFTPKLQSPSRGAYRVVEGHDFSLALATNYAAVGRTFTSLAGQATLRPVTVRVFRNARILSSVNRILLIATLLACFAIALLLRNKITVAKLGFVFFSPVLIETFGPQRYAYCDVTLAPILLLVIGFAFASDALGKTERIIILGLVAVCAGSAIAVFVLSPSGKAIMIVSLIHWFYVVCSITLLLARISYRTQPALQDRFHAAQGV